MTNVRGAGPREDAREDAREFLRSRRARLTPDQVGLVPTGGLRRVPGLRREEVAMLAGVSVDYYTRLEKGNLRTASDQVLDAIAGALRLDDAERVHLFDLARVARSGRGVRGTGAPGEEAGSAQVPESLRRLLTGMPGVPAMICNGRLDIVAVNPLARALYAPVFDSPTSTPAGVANLARFRFLDPASRVFYPRWEESARTPVGLLRLQAGHRPFDRALSNLIGELCTRSAEFRELWAAHDVRSHDTGVKHLCHPVVGELALDFDAMTVDADRTLRFLAYTAAPGTPAAAALAELEVPAP